MANKALDFNGTSGLVTVTDAASIQNIFDGGGTVEFWIKVRSDGEADTGRIFSKGMPVLWVASESDSKVKLAFFYNFSGNDGFWTTTSTEIDLNTPTHGVITYDNSLTTNDPILYINGSVVALTEDNTPTGTRTSDVGVDLIIGNLQVDTNTFDGIIGEMRFYTRIMGQTEVTANYNGGAFRDWPSNLNNLVGWWKFNEGSGSIIRDETNRGNTGVIAGVSWADGFDFLIQNNVPRRR